jgi:hypothetical protein
MAVGSYQKVCELIKLSVILWNISSNAEASDWLTVLEVFPQRDSPWAIVEFDCCSCCCRFPLALTASALSFRMNYSSFVLSRLVDRMLVPSATKPVPA